MAAVSKTEANVAGTAAVDAAFARKLYEDMLLIRRFEEKAGQLYGMGLIGGFCHLYIGQEAVVIGMQAALEPGDQVITAYRDHGHMLATGMDAKGVMAELTGRAAGYSRGKGGSMHMFSREKNFFGGHGIVGAQVPIGTGLAFANRYRENGAVSLTYLGDGAANQGQVYESFNMAELWKLPVVYVIENNRGGKGPIILEMKTYRYRGHSMSDPAKYRTREEVQSVREKRDPIEHYGQRLLARKQASDQELKAIDKNVRMAVNMAAEFATESPEPGPAELYTNVSG